MANKIIEERLLNYNVANSQERVIALKETLQYIVLLALSRANFFKIAAFQGGTCLRLCYSLARFSEDLDFILIEPDRSFSWDAFRKALEQEFAAYELDLEIHDRSKATAAVKSAFLKEKSFGKILSFEPLITSFPPQPISIKIEIDSDPPQGSKFSTHFLNFPVMFSVTAQDGPSLFASKCHALLCRKYHKGRDWYDFLWYVLRQTPINYVHLEAALHQHGPWAGTDIVLTKSWLLDALRNKIKSLDIEKAQKDVLPFLQVRDQAVVNSWDLKLFLDFVNKLDSYLPER